LQKGATSTRDLSKPFREAYNTDNTLKDASEMEWVHLPSQSVAVGSTEKQAHDGGDKSSSEGDANVEKKNLFGRPGSDWVQTSGSGPGPAKFAWTGAGLDLGQCSSSSH